MIAVLERIKSPADLRQLQLKELDALALELRRIITETVAANGGHLASNCGIVELTIALHRVFNTPDEKIFFDVGHQAYAHKLLTGRGGKFASLRKIDGISGFPDPAESPFDPAPAGHGGSALSLALGAAAAMPDAAERVIAVVGDGCAGCGVTFEAMNNAAVCPGKERLLVILNDNQMSIAENVGALSRYLGKVISGKFYNRIRGGFKRKLRHFPGVFRLIRGLVYAFKRALIPRGNFFEALGFRYLGPVDGHDMTELLRVLSQSRNLSGPLLIHVVTRKGFGCKFAEDNPTGYHGISRCDAITGELPVSTGGFSRVLGDALVKLGDKDPRIAAVSAGMVDGTGLRPFFEKFPQRSFDVGIAEEHAVTFACGLAGNGMRPVCAVYDTFLQRALDGIYHDGILANLPLIIAADRAGVVEDGPTHHGIYNCGFLRSLPGITIVCPAFPDEVSACLELALELSSPTVIRYPRGGVPERSLPELPPWKHGKAAVVISCDDPEQIVIWSIGAELFTALEVADILKSDGIPVSVIDARFLKPFDRELAEKYCRYRQFTIENHCISGGLYSALLEALSGVAHAGVTGFGWPDDQIIPYGEVGRLREKYHLTSKFIAERIRAESGKIR